MERKEEEEKRRIHVCLVSTHFLMIIIYVVFSPLAVIMFRLQQHFHSLKRNKYNFAISLNLNYCKHINRYPFGSYFAARTERPE